MTFHIEYPRIVPAQRPDGHTPAASRYTLRWEQPINRVISVYFGIQGRELPWAEQSAFFKRLRSSFDDTNGPEAHEIMRCIDEAGFVNAILIAYWTNPNSHAHWHRHSDFSVWFDAPERLNERYGYWRETINVHYDRHETIYSENNYRVGLGRCPGTVVETMTTNGYFGAARDRFPASAVDTLTSTFPMQQRSLNDIDTARRRLHAGTPHNLTVIRSGQYWARASTEQFADYKRSLQPKLMEGMQYLIDNKEKTGTLSLRVMTNLDEDGSERHETSVNAYFAALADMENWASSHPTHQKIYDHAIAKNREYGKNREVVTWHEVFLLTAGTPFEYVNCHSGTGVMPFCPLYERFDS